ncbi:MAG TPA: LacI family DNA-binding transcriptional regulator [Nocardioidaceae bacterium]|nr:LacI family DNA-binding transcriptional regulator [Nocardioidaceae bacterium]
MVRSAATRAGANITAVALHAGVSRQTVSNALNRPSRLHPDTLARVLASIDELGYRPNQAARSLRTQASRVIGCRLLSEEAVAAGGVIDRFMHSLCIAARESRYDVLTFAVGDEGEEIDAFSDLIRRTAVDGFVLTGTHRDDRRADWLLRSGAQFVAFGRPWGAASPRHSWVDVDGAAGVEASVRHLVEQGFRRVGFVGWPEGSGVGDDRHEGWLRACRAHRLPIQHLALRAEDGVDTGEALAGRLLDRSRSADAIVCVSDRMAIGAVRAVEARGLVAGVDVAVTGFDDSPAAGVVRPGLTSVRQPLEQAARRIVQVLTDLLTGRSQGPVTELLTPTLVVRESSTGTARW